MLLIKKKMHTIALCFMTQRLSANQEAWQPFFDHPGFTVYTHNDKYMTRQRKLCGGTQTTNCIPTSYATSSLVYAEGELYRDAIVNTRNKYFVMLSETHLPVLSPECTYHHIIQQMEHEPGTGSVFIGIFQQQNTYRSFMSPFLDMADNIVSDRYLIPREKSNGIIATLQWKILTRKGVSEFLLMLKDVSFMSLFEKNKHYTADTVLHTEGCDIVLPYSAPDECTFVMWCNYRTYSTQTEYQLCLAPFTKYRYDTERKRVMTFDSVGAHGRYGRNLTIFDTCDPFTLFVRKVNVGTYVQLPFKQDTLCGCQEKPPVIVRYDHYYIAEFLPCFILKPISECGDGYEHVINRCLPVCTGENEIREPFSFTCVPKCTSGVFDTRTGKCVPSDNVKTYRDTNKNRNLQRVGRPYTYYGFL